MMGPSNTINRLGGRQSTAISWEHRRASTVNAKAPVQAQAQGVRRVQAQPPAGLPQGRTSVQAHAVATSIPESGTEPGTKSSSESGSASGYQFQIDAFSKVESEQQFLGLLKMLVQAGKAPPKLLPLWEDFYNNYKTAVLGSKVDGANEKTVAKIQATIADCVFTQFKDPYTFPSFHSRILEPYNYFEFGQRYVGSLTDFDNSLLGNSHIWDQIAAQIAANNNVILLANHQTEADPGVFAHMLLAAQPKLATDVIYVAGDRVVSDAMCKPFSMGRNLFCVHSKKRMDDEPELKAAKMETNRRTLVEMARRLNAGGQLIWIAPSGGRDRPGKDGKTKPDRFEPTAVELMRSLGARAKQPTHLYPMAMFSYPMMPPPNTLDKDVGERRLTNFTPVGISVCPKLDATAIISGIPEKEAQQAALADAAWKAVCAEYDDLVAALEDPSKRIAPRWAQPWREAAKKA